MGRTNSTHPALLGGLPSEDEAEPDLEAVRLRSSGAQRWREERAPARRARNPGEKLGKHLLWLPVLPPEGAVPSPSLVAGDLQN